MTVLTQSPLAATGTPAGSDAVLSMIAALAIVFLVHQARTLFRQNLAMVTQTIKAVASIGLAILVVAMFVAMFVALIVAANATH